MTDRSYYIFPMDLETYDEFKESRVYRKRQSNFTKFKPINENDLILIFNRDNNRIIAEYEVIHVRITKAQVKLIVEPIYNSPPHSGILMNKLMLIQLEIFEDIKSWEKEIEEPIIEINEADFYLLSNKLPK